MNLHSVVMTPWWFSRHSHRRPAPLWLARFVQRRRAQKTAFPAAALHTVADAAYPRLLRLWLDAFVAAGEAVDLDTLAGLLTGGDVIGAEQLLLSTWTQAGLGPLPEPLLALLGSTVTQGADAAIASWPALTGVAFQGRFDLAAPEAAAWLTRFGADQIAQIDEATRQGINTLLVRVLAAAEPPAQQARSLRSLIGLTSQQQGAVDTYYAGLLDAGTPVVEARALRDTRAGQKLRDRAETIAHTESMTAANAGNQLLVTQAQADGWLEPDQRRQWVITRDSRLCPICEAIPGQNPGGVGLTEPFATDVGPVLFPPAHVSCRCTASLL